MTKTKLLAGLTVVLLIFSGKPYAHAAEQTNVTNKKQHGTTMKNLKPNKTTLAAMLNEKKAAFESKAPEEKKKVYADGLQSLIDTGILDKAMNVGDKAPNFVLNNQKGEPVSLYNQLKDGPVVLIWYRGGWCPYCNLTLHYLQERLPDFKKAGASLVALTPELPDKSLSTSEKHNLGFMVLSDVGNKIGKEYGVVFQLTKDVAESYQKSFGLHEYNGDESNELPLAATYVIDEDGIIQYAFLDADYRNRAEPDDIIKALSELDAK